MVIAYTSEMDVPGRLKESQNSFTFLRLVLAMMVLYGHAYAIGGFGGDPIFCWSIGQTSCQELGVKGFFVLSGYLLMHSLAINPSLRRFMLRRMFRILPAYWMTLALSAFVLTPVLVAVFTKGRAGYFEGITSGEQSATGYFLKNGLLYIGQMEIIPGMLHEQKPLLINGSLWSLFYEAMCYVGLGLAAWSGLIRRRSVILIVFGLLYLPLAINFVWPFSFFSSTTPLKLAVNLAFSPSGPCVALAFAAGAAAYAVTRGKLPWNPRHFLLVLLVSAVALTYGGFSIVWPFALPYLLLSLAGRLPFQKLDRAGDASYGIYLYASLIQHCLLLFGVQRMGLGVYLALSTLLSAGCGVLSWYAVEKPFIRWGQRLIKKYGLAVDTGRKCPLSGLQHDPVLMN